MRSSVILTACVMLAFIVVGFSEETKQCAAGEGGDCAASPPAPPPARQQPDATELRPPASPPAEGPADGSDSTSAKPDAAGEDLPLPKGEKGKDDEDEWDDDEGDGDDEDFEDMDWDKMTKVFGDVLEEAKGIDGLGDMIEGKDAKDIFGGAATSVANLIAAATPFAKAMIGKSKDANAGTKIAENLEKFASTLDDETVKSAADIAGSLFTNLAKGMKAANRPQEPERDEEEEPGVLFTKEHRRRTGGDAKKKEAPGPEIPDFSEFSNAVDADMVKNTIKGMAGYVDGLSGEAIKERVQSAIEMAPQLLQAAQQLAGAGGMGGMPGM